LRRALAIQRSAAGLPTCKCPRRVRFVHAYPAIATGEICRVERRSMAGGLLSAERGS
jgi:hypothetical protein